MTYEIANRQPGKKPSRWGAIIAWVILLIALLTMFISISSGSSTERVGGALVSSAIGFPAAWALYCRSVDRKNAIGFSGTRKPRRWATVSVAAIAILMAGGFILPSTETADIKPATVEKTEVPSTTAAKKTSGATSDDEDKAAEESRKKDAQKKAAEKSAARESEEKKAEEERLQAEREAEVERQRLEAEQAQAEAERLAEEQILQAEREAEAERVATAERERVAQEQARIEQERIQQQQIQQRAPVMPAQTTSYKNCTDVWNRIGRPIYAGEPGYVSGRGKLDGNSDGVGCEKDPR